MMGRKELLWRLVDCGWRLLGLFGQAEGPAKDERDRAEGFCCVFFLEYWSDPKTLFVFVLHKNYR
jgi:hypothetical protein